MSKKIILDAGRGYNTAGKRTPKDVREWTINDAVCRYAAASFSTIGSGISFCEDKSRYRLV